MITPRKKPIRNLEPSGRGGGNGDDVGNVSNVGIGNGEGDGDEDGGVGDDGRGRVRVVKSPLCMKLTPIQNHEGARPGPTHPRLRP